MFNKLSNFKMGQILHYLNPIARFGKRDYSTLFPLIGMVTCILVFEFIAYFVLSDPNDISISAIFVFVALVIYFAFCDGIRGGLIATGVSVGYYIYILYSRNYTGVRLESGVRTIVLLASLYIFLSSVIGWLKQTIDQLIEREGDEKRRLRAIIQQLPVGVIITDRKGIIELANKKADSMLGKIQIGAVLNKVNFLNSLNQDNISKDSKSLLTQVLTGKKIISNKELTIQHKDGKQLFVQTSAAIVRNKYGKVIAIASILNDMTQQKQIEKSKDDFVNMASHELKTPLTSIKLYLDMVIRHIRKYQDAKAEKNLHNIHYQLGRLEKLVKDLLDVSRLQTGKLTFDKEEFRLDELIQETVDELKGTAKQTVIYSSKIAVKVVADKFRIYQVLANLLTNAIKYSPPDKEIIVKIQRSDGKVIVSVQDFGIGVDKEQQKKIFDRLYQVIDDKEKTFPGFGMGLYISKEIIKKHKGNIWVESEKEKGSIFCFSLPLRK